MQDYYFELCNLFSVRRSKLSREKLIVFHRPIRIVSPVVFCSARRSGASIQKLIVVNRSTSEGRASWNRPGGARVQSSKVSRGSLMKVISIQGSDVHFYSEILPQLSAPLRVRTTSYPVVKVQKLIKKRRQSFYIFFISFPERQN